MAIPPPVDFLGLPLTDSGIDGLMDWLLADGLAARTAGYLNAHTVNLALRGGGKLGREIFSRFDVLYPDGMSVVRAARRRGIAIRERVSAADFFWRFLWLAAARRKSIALVGGDAATNLACAENIAARVPDLEIAFAHHGFFDADSETEKLVAKSLVELRPSVVLVGMGTSRQEEFALMLRDRFALPAAWCVGALFEYHAPGVRRHAPLWMRERGLEWAYRLGQEPRRLGRRYLLGNAEFLLRSRGIL